MKFTAIDLYQSFQCMAEDCPDTCCAGWRIVVDKQAYDRFKKLTQHSLREDVLSHLRQEGELLFFENDEFGRCTMLNPDGLCRLQLNTSEKMLCNTCRKYPRLVNICDNTLYLSMAASCPVVSERLFHHGFEFVQGEDNNVTGHKFSLMKSPLTQEVYSLASEGFGQACSLLNHKGIVSLPTDIPLLAKTVLRLAGEIREIGKYYKEGKQALELITVLEMWTQLDILEEELTIFCRRQQKCWERLRSNIFPYRVFSRRLEYPVEKAEECLCQVQGELLLIRLFAFCCHLQESDRNVSDHAWQNCIRKAYRFCAHGKNCAQEVHQGFQQFFVQKLLWWFVLF